jgi:RNA polymerase sigma-70 factor (ECF subfamily)
MEGALAGGPVSSGTGDNEAAFRQVMAHRTMLASYVRALVHDPDAAEDVFADVSVELVRSWPAYDQSRPFGPWARGVARRVALANARRFGRRPVLLGEQALEVVGAALDSLGDETRMAERAEALRLCLEGMPEQDREMLRMRYFQNRSYEQIAKAVNRTVGALYVAFYRMHRVLRECIRRRLETA